MLDFQTKTNLDGDPVQFLANSHDQAELNSQMQELKNAALSGRQPLTDLVDYATEDKTKLGKSIIANSGYILEITNYDGGSKTLTLEPYDSNTIMPDLSTMNLYTFRFYTEGSTIYDVDNLTVLGVTKQLQTLTSGPTTKKIYKFKVYTIMYNSGVDAFVIVDSSNVISNYERIGFIPSVVIDPSETSDHSTSQYVITGEKINIEYYLKWTGVTGDIDTITIDYPTFAGIAVTRDVLPINIIVSIKIGAIYYQIFGTLNVSTIIFLKADNTAVFTGLSADDVELNFQANFIALNLKA